MKETYGVPVKEIQEGIKLIIQIHCCHNFIGRVGALELPQTRLRPAGTAEKQQRFSN
jgi:hypothetical protein